MFKRCSDKLLYILCIAKPKQRQQQTRRGDGEKGERRGDREGGVKGAVVGEKKRERERGRG